MAKQKRSEAVDSSAVERVKMLGIYHVGHGKYALIEADVPITEVHCFGDMPRNRALDELRVKQAKLYLGRPL